MKSNFSQNLTDIESSFAGTWISVESEFVSYLISALIKLTSAKSASKRFPWKKNTQQRRKYGLKPS